MHWTLSDRVNDLALDNHVAWNRAAVVLIELGIPVMNKLKVDSPAFLQDLLHERHKLLNEKESARIQRVVDGTSKRMKLNDRIAAALPAATKQRIKRLAKRRETSMSRLLRHSLEMI